LFVEVGKRKRPDDDADAESTMKALVGRRVATVSDARVADNK